jgi:hypothetical protein
MKEYSMEQLNRSPMKVVLCVLLLLAGINYAAKAQTFMNVDSVSNVPYICQADSFTVTISGTLPSTGFTLDSVRHIYRNDTLLIRLNYSFLAGFHVLYPFQLNLKFATPPSTGPYTIFSDRFHNGVSTAQGTSHIAVCSPLSVIPEAAVNGLKINVYPNPTSNLLNIEIPDNAKTPTAQLSDLAGKVLLTRQFQANKQKQLHLENLPVGIYFLNLETEIGKTVRKIIKN